MRAALLCALLLVAGPVGAGPLSDLVMAPGVLADAPAGEVLRYRLDRSLPPMTAAAGGQPVPRPVEDGVLILASPGAGALVLTLQEGEARHELARFAATGPNPALLFFLENVVRAVAAGTGGSPFYIRNRIREALVAADQALLVGGGPVVAVLHPFETDANRARMGRFADLALSLTLDPAQPGRLLDLKADTGAAADGYTERMTLIEVE